MQAIHAHCSGEATKEISRTTSVSRAPPSAAVNLHGGDGSAGEKTADANSVRLEEGEQEKPEVTWLSKSCNQIFLDT